MPPISVLIKPASGACQLRCAYCFYRDDAHSRGTMPRQTADRLIYAVLDEAEGEASFAFQGGEPLLAGLDFYREFAETAERLNAGRLRINWSIQTNGMLLTDDFARFFKERGFLVGLSLDGTSDIHDKYRRTAAGEPTFAAVSAAADRLAEAKVPFNILTVVTPRLCRQPEKVYGYYKKRGWRFLQFITCLEALSGPKHGCAPTEREYCRFISGLFALWYDDFMRGDYVSVRWFDNLALVLAGRGAELCGMRGQCTNQLVFESDGSCYPCDFYVDERYLLGNINEASIAELRRAPANGLFLADGESRSEECAKCEFFALCRGGCRRERGTDGKSVLCGALKRFFAENIDKLREVAARI